MADSDHSNLPTGRFSRLLKLSKLTGSVSGNFLASKIKGTFSSDDRAEEMTREAHIINARKIVETMGELKGAVMKLGQMISIQNDGSLPEESFDILSKLQSDAPSMEYDLIRRQVFTELKEYPEYIFDYFSKEPIASASLGQVHLARLKDGREVAVKVQYPGISETVKSDLKNMHSLVRTLAAVARSFDVKKVIAEIEQRLTEELDYTLEAAHMERFNAFYRSSPYFVVPHFFKEYSSKRVLTMEYLEGIPLSRFFDENVDQSKIDEIAEKLVRFILSSLFGMQSLHADPHPGNYLHLADGRLGILDFGCVKVFSEEFMGNIVEVGKALQSHDENATKLYYTQLGFTNDIYDPRFPRIFEFAKFALRPWIEDRRFTFTKEFILEGRDAAFKYVRNAGLTVPEDFVFFNRTFGGVYGILSKVNASGNWYQLLKHYLDGAAAP